MTQADAHPAGWTRRSLVDLATVHMGQSPPGKSVNDTGNGVPFLQGNAEFGTTSPTATHWCTQPGRIAEEGDLLISVRAPVGELNIADQRYCIGRGLGAIRIAEDDRAFLWAALHFERRRLNRVSQGSTFDAIGRDDLEQLPLLCPPVSERRRIAEILGAVDAAIDATRGVIEQTRRLKTAVLQDLLTRGLPGRHGEFREVKGLGQVPRAWSIIALGDLLEDLRYGTSAKCTSDRQSVAVLRIPNIVRDTTEDVEMKWADLPPAELKRLRLMAGDVVLVRTNGNPNYVGRSVVFSQESGVWAFASYLIRARCKRERLLPEYLHAFLNSHRGRRELVGGIRTSAGNYNLNTDTIRTTRIPLPDPNEQGTIIEALRSIEQRVGRAEAHLFGLAQLKTALSQALLTGRVRVPAAKGVPVAS